MRPFPPPSKEALTAFIYHSVQLERLPITFGDISKSMTLKETDADIDPHACGHFKAINHVLKITKEDSLLKDIEWTKTLHKMLFEPIVRHDWITASDQPFPPAAVGTYRLTEKFIGNTRMPNPFQIPRLMEELRQKLLQLDQRLATKMTNARLLTPEDLKDIRTTAHMANLDICCIKPFLDGSNRVGRLVENCLRLHWLMPWQVFSSDPNPKDDLIEELEAHQRLFK